MKLIIGNSECRVEGMTNEVYTALKKVLFYESENVSHYTGGYKETKRYLITRQGVFPTGLLYLVDSYLLEIGCEFSDSRKDPGLLKVIYEPKFKFTPYADQLDAVRQAKRHSRGVIAMPTGTGKSLTMMLLIQVLGLKTLIVVPTVELKRQLSDTVEAYFGKTKNIMVENISSPSLEKLTDFDLLLVDEGHHAAAKTYRDLNKKAWRGIYYRFFFTATPFRSRDEENILFESLAGKVIYRLGYEESVTRGYIVPVEAYYQEVPRTRPVQGFTWAEVYNELVVENEVRNDLITKLMLSLHSADKSALVLVKEIEHGERLSAGGAFPFANGVNKDTKNLIKLFNAGKIKVLIGTVGVLGEGIDTKPCEYVIIAGLGKSKNAFMQQVGRTVRRFEGKASGKVIIFSDKSHKWTRAHFNAQVKHLAEEYGILPVSLETN